MSPSHKFSTSCPNSHLVMLQQFIITFTCSHFVHTFCTAETCHLRCGIYIALVLQARLAPIPRLPILAVWRCSRSLSLSQARLLSAWDLQHLTWRLSCCLLEVGHQKIGTVLRVIVWVICASHDTCGVAAVFCAILTSS